MLPPLIADRVAGALWGMFIADALAMPSHWFYGGRPQVEAIFKGPIDGYMAPPLHLSGSIMALSATGGAGRGSGDGDIIGSVINHGKKQYWARGSEYHYHCTLQAGENTLEAQIARLAMRSMARGGFDFDRMQQEYVNFMTTPGSHNDAYASSYHRMFFANRQRGVALRGCADNDGHNVDAIDGLILPLPVILGTLFMERQASIDIAKESVRVTRKSTAVASYIEDMVDMLRAVIEGQTAHNAAQDAAVRRYGRKLEETAPDPVVACYISQNFPSMLHFAVKYDDFRSCLLANANAGGENVHRGILLGALMGAASGASGIPADLKTGLKHASSLRAEIASFLDWLGTQAVITSDL
mmetsp:Transcript_18933/g.44045  ORF Transcript_18933/g.44045 Transcript_18933/m.44045 type:complete len:355 (-) Transcript_18933:107-1171(-)